MKHALRLGAFMYLWVGLSWAVLAQCPTAASYTATSTAATCPSNGTIRVANAADQPLSSGGQGVPCLLYTSPSPRD